MHAKKASKQTNQGSGHTKNLSYLRNEVTKKSSDQIKTTNQTKETSKEGKHASKSSKQTK